MKNQATKGKSGLVLEKLSENELETVFGGNKYFDGFFKYGFLDIPGDFYYLVTDIFDGKPASSVCDALVIAGKIVFGAVCYGIYKGGSVVVRKLKRKSVKKEAVSGKQNVVVS